MDVGRKVYIVPPGDMSDPQWAAQRTAEAAALGIAEIVEGIPPALLGRVSENLPQVYEEPDPPAQAQSEVEVLRAQVADLQQVVADMAELLLEKGVLP